MLNINVHYCTLECDFSHRNKYIARGGGVAELLEICIISNFHNHWQKDNLETEMYWSVQLLTVNGSTLHFCYADVSAIQL
jgi:hypothetical protein